MATTYLTLVNNVLKELNELTLSDFTNKVGIHLFVQEAVLKASRDVNNAEIEWPFNYASGSQLLTPGTQLYTLPSGFTSIDWDSFTLIPTEKVTNGAFTSNITSWTDISTGTGSAAYTSDGNGRLRLAGGASGVGAVTQALTLISGYEYRIIVRTFTGTISLDIGTTSGGDEIAGYNLTIGNEGLGQYNTIYFTASDSTVYITFRNSTNANHDVDYVSVVRNIDARHLWYVDYDNWLKMYKGREALASHESYGMPERVFFDQNGKFGISPVPFEDHTVTFDYWAAPTAMSTVSSTTNIPDRWINAIVERALYYHYKQLGDLDEMREARDNYRAIINQMRVELINKPQRMKAI